MRDVRVSRDVGRDCALAALAACGSWGLFALSLTGPEKPGGLVSLHAGAITALLVAQALALCIRRRRPVACLYTVVAFQVLVMVLLDPTDAIRTPPQLIAAYTVGSLLPPGTAAVVVAAGVLAETVGYVAVHFQSDSALSLVGEEFVAAALLYGIGAMIGAQFAVQRRYAVLARLREREATENQRSRQVAAVGRERARMARELHDIAAHHLSGLVIQAAVLERMIDDDPAAAKRTAAWIRGQGRETLDDLRLVVGVLRGSTPGDDGAEASGTRAPVPGLAVLDHLVTTARELGTPAELLRVGAERELPPVADVTFYRVAQEALANVRAHAPGAPTRITVDHRPVETVLTVDNDAVPTRTGERPEHSGFGLAGMRERADLIGAVFDAGPTGSGGWRVRLALRTGTAEGKS